MFPTEGQRRVRGQEIRPALVISRKGTAVAPRLGMNPADYRARTRAFAIAVIREVRTFPRTLVCREIGGQLIRAAGGTGSNYRAACRGRSTAEFVAKLGNVLEEADESAFWLDVLTESGEDVRVERLRALEQEANEIARMTVASIRTSARSLPEGHPARRLDTSRRQPSIDNQQSAFGNE
jgi:four helix bundle protein